MKEYYLELGEYVSFYDDKNGLEATKNLDNIKDIFVYQNLIERLEEEITVANNKIRFINGIKKTFNDKLLEKYNLFIPVRTIAFSIFLKIFSNLLLLNANPEFMMVSPQFLSMGAPIAGALLLGIFDFYDYYNYRVRNKTKNALKVEREILNEELAKAKSKLEELEKASKPIKRVELQNKKIRNDELKVTEQVADYYTYLAYHFNKYFKANEKGKLETVLKKDGYEGENLIDALDYIINNPHKLEVAPRGKRRVLRRG